MIAKLKTSLERCYGTSQSGAYISKLKLCVGCTAFFFTFSEKEEGDSLQFLLAWEDRNQVFSMALENNLEKSLEKSLLYLKTRRERREALDLLSRLLNLVLYLCTRNAEYGGERPSPTNA